MATTAAPPNSRRSSIARIGVAIVVAACVLITISSSLADWWVASKYQPQIPFDREAWEQSELPDSEPSLRQRMIRDLVTNILPGKNRAEIEALLGPSPSHEQMRRYTDADLEFRAKDEDGNWRPFPRTGEGHYYDELGWDLIYPIGCEQILIFDHKGQELSPDGEHLIIRVDQHERFESWYIDGSTRWKRIVNTDALQSFRETARN